MIIMHCKQRSQVIQQIVHSTSIQYLLVHTNGVRSSMLCAATEALRDYWHQDLRVQLEKLLLFLQFQATNKTLNLQQSSIHQMHCNPKI